VQQQQQQWHHHQGSTSHLPASNEQDEDNLDPFLQKDETPQVPPKDIQYQQNLQQPQHFAPQPHQEQLQYNRPPLDRVSTEGSYSTQGGVDQYSPEQHQGQGIQQPRHQQQQYQSYQPAVQHPQASGDYQAFNPQTVPSPLLQNAQLHGQSGQVPQDIQQTYYLYQQQQAKLQAQGQSSLDNAHQKTLYPQQQFATQLQPHQDPQQQQPQSVRPASQQQSDLQPPQLAHQHPQIAQEPQQIESQRRPPSSHQLGPPSPLQPQSYQTYDAQHPQSSDRLQTNITPPQQAQDVMAPSAQSNARNTLRKVNDGSQPQPGAPSRESSLLSQPPAQGQPHGQPPASPGLATFDANVVPTASQGQPYRGEKQTQQVSEMGRATPPPRTSVTEMSEEDVEKLQKEHDVLRMFIPLKVQFHLTHHRRKVPKGQAILFRAAITGPPATKHPRKSALVSVSHILGRQRIRDTLQSFRRIDRAIVILHSQGLEKYTPLAA
jgi:hypothetical protein